MSDGNFPERVAYCIQQMGGMRPAARKTGISTTQLDSYKAGSEPNRPRLITIAESAGVDLNWLATGQGKPDSVADGFVGIPRYDARLAAGAGSWNDGRRVLDHIPFTLEFLRQRLRRSSGRGLSVLESEGDSMEPTIANGALLLIDEEDQRIVDGIFAFVLDGDARVKRIRKLTDALMLISDNKAYPPEVVGSDNLEKLQIIGRVRWVGQTL